MKKRKKQNARPSEQDHSRKPIGSRRWLPVAVLLVGVVILAVPAWRYYSLQKADMPTRSDFELSEIPFDGEKAMDWIERLCEIGPRPSGSDGMTCQQEMLAEHFEACGAQVVRQEFTGKDPRNGADVPMTNLIARWRPEREQRILLCAHYDTLPFPLLDPVDPQGVFVGANDGGSGVAVLAVLAEELDELLEEDQMGFGVDIVLFDAEEYIFASGQPMFLGSGYFAQAYRDGRLPFEAEYRWGVLLDMIGDADLQLPYERNSKWWTDTSPLAEAIWAKAAELGVYEFTPRPKYDISDDHIPLHDIGRIPTIDIIDFDYPVWHTQGDVPEACSAESLAKVGWVVREWLRDAKPDQGKHAKPDKKK